MVAADHLAILQVAVPLFAAPVCALFRRGDWAWRLATLISWVSAFISLKLLYITAQSGPISYAIGGWAAAKLLPCQTAKQFEKVQRDSVAISNLGTAQSIGPHRHAKVTRHRDLVGRRVRGRRLTATRARGQPDTSLVGTCTTTRYIRSSYACTRAKSPYAVAAVVHGGELETCEDGELAQGQPPLHWRAEHALYAAKS